MIGHFPVPHPDELLYSVCARAAALLNPPSKRGFCEMLFGPGAIAVCDFPSRLRFLSAQLPPAHPATAEDFLKRNTLLPLFLPFLPTERAERCFSAALSDGGKKLPFLSGVMASRLTQPMHLRLCPKCFDEDRAAYGEASWHRSHQIEGVHTCHHHQIPLVEAPVRRRGRQNRHEFHCPTNTWQQFNSAVSEEDVRLAADTHWLLNQNTTQPGFTTLREAYIEALQEKRLAHPSGRVYLSHLNEQFLHFHGKEFLATLNCSLDTDENWLVQLVRKRRVRCAHPIQHLLFIHFVGHSAQSFFQIVSTPHPKPVTLTPALKASRIKNVNTELLQKLWADPTISLREIGRQLRVDPMTVKRKAAKSGLKFPRHAIRPTRKIPILRQVRPQTKLQHHRLRWERALRSRNPASLRSRLPSSYSYLFRYDRQWLNAHRPPSPLPIIRKERVNWSERDTRLATEAEAIASRGGKSPAAIHAELGIASLLRQNADKLPKTVQIIAEYTQAENARPFRNMLPQPTKTAAPNSHRSN